MSKQRVGFIAVIGGAVLLIAGRVSLFLSVSKNAASKDLPANIQPLSGIQTTLPNDTIPTETEQPLPNEPTEPVSVPLVPDTPTTLQPNAVVRVLLPPYADIEKRKAFALSMKEKNGITTSFQYFDTRRSYKTALIYHHNAQDSIDIAMIPTIRLRSFHDRGVPLEFKDSLTPFFHPLFSPLLTDSSVTFIPYTLDAPVTLFSKKVFGGQTTFGGLLSSAGVQLETTDAMGLVFGINEAIVTNKEDEPFFGFFTLLSFFLQQAAQSGQPDALIFLQNIPTRNTVLFGTIQERLALQNPLCNSLPIPCFIAYDAGSAGFSFLHSIEQRTLSADDFNGTVSPFPGTKSAYPLIGRGRVLNKSSTAKNESALWLQDYLHFLSEQRAPTPFRLLSAYNEMYQQQKIQETFERYLPYQFTSFLMLGTLHDEENVRKQTSLEELLKGGFSSAIYTQQLQRFFAGEPAS